MARKRAAAGRLVSYDMDAKHASLMQDYVQLQHEFEALKGRLQAANVRKTILTAEVRFLRRRLKKLKGTPSALKGKQTACAAPHCDSSIACGRKAAFGVIAPEPSALPPKNNPLGSTQVPVFWEPFNPNGSGKYGKWKPVNDNSELATGLRNRPNVFVTAVTGKKTISWQDQISLECN